MGCSLGYWTGYLRNSSLRLLILALAMEAILLILSSAADFRVHLVETILFLLLSSLLYLVCVYFILKSPVAANPLQTKKLRTVILGMALVFRFTVWPMFPALSDDPFRYRWEGKLQAAGGNPYQVRPNDDEWSHLRDATFHRIPAPDFKAGYGPLLELMEHGTYRAVSSVTSDPFAQVFWFKLPSAMFDLGAIAALWALLAAKGLPVERILIYAWSPLPVVEFWATGHNDSVAVFFVLLALLAAARERWIWAFTALSLAAGAKLWPVLLFPIFVGWRGLRPLRWYQWLIAAPVAAVLFWPYRSNLWENARFMSGFVGGWRNNDSLFGLLFWYTGDLYEAKYLAFAIIIGSALALTLLRWPPERACLWAIAIMLMFSANCHPWYLTWILPLLAFAPSPALLLWTALIPVAYQVLIEWTLVDVWRGSTGFRWLIYVPVYGLLCWTALASVARNFLAKNGTIVSRRP